MGANGFVGRRTSKWVVGVGCLALVLAVVLGGVGGPAGGRVLAQGGTPSTVPTATPDPTVAAVERAVDNLLAQQGEDGGFLGFSGEADPGTTTDAVYALKAAGFRGVDVDPALEAAVGYLGDQGAAYAASGPGQAAKVALALVAAGEDPKDFGGVDLLAAATAPVGTPAAGAEVATPAVAPGVYGSGIYDHALVVLALAAAGAPVPAEAIDALRATQGDDGSWGFDGSTAPGSGDSNTTALVVQALVASGNGTDPAIEAALAYFRTVETTQGQFAFAAADPLVADANSTALVIQAILAVGQDPASADDWGNPARGLAAFQNVSGAFRYQDAEPADNLLATLQAIPALAGVPLPVGVTCPAASTEAGAETANGTPIVALPVPAGAEVPCVELAA